MNPAHVTVSAAGGTAFGSALAAVIAHWYKIDVDLASSWVVVIMGIVAFIGGLVVWFFSWKWPKVPPPPVLVSSVAATAPKSSRGVLPETHLDVPTPGPLAPARESS